MEQGKIKSFDKKNLHYYLIESKNPKYIVQIAHGMQEYSKTYFEFAEFLAKNNCIVFMFDQRAHGKTAGKENLGKVEGDIFEQTVNDHKFISKYLIEKYRLPLILFGHSYGSFISQQYVLECDLADKVILCGSAYMNVPKIKLAKILTNLLSKIRGEHKTSLLLENLTLKAYAKRFKNKSGSWITSDEEKTKEFYEDKLNGQPSSIGFYKYMFNHQVKLYKKQILLNAKNNAKIYIVSGDRDVIGENGKLVKRLYNTYKKHGFNVTMNLYPNLRHGLVQEVNRKSIFKDLLKYINK